MQTIKYIFPSFLFAARLTEQTNIKVAKRLSVLGPLVVEFSINLNTRYGKLPYHLGNSELGQGLYDTSSR